MGRNKIDETLKKKQRVIRTYDEDEILLKSHFGSRQKALNAFISMLRKFPHKIIFLHNHIEQDGKNE